VQKIVIAAGLLQLTLLWPVFAQQGRVSGVVLGEGGWLLPYASVVALGTTLGSMSSSDGRFQLTLPAGSHTLKVMALGWKSQEHDVTVTGDRKTLVTVMLEPDDNGVVTEAGGGVFVPVPLDSMTGWHYPARSKPVIHGPLEFSLRYCLADEGDSILVNVIAEGRNVSNAPMSTCGCFSIWHSYDISLDVWIKEIPPSVSLIKRLPVPVVPHWRCYPDAPRLECVAEIVAPGSSVARGIAFKFSRSDFSRWTVDLDLKATYLAGVDGTDWDHTQQVILERLVVPIRPIGQPMTSH
jgi:hypothetical protein